MPHAPNTPWEERYYIENNALCKALTRVMMENQANPLSSDTVAEIIRVAVSVSRDDPNGFFAEMGRMLVSGRCGPKKQEAYMDILLGLYRLIAEDIIPDALSLVLEKAKPKILENLKELFQDEMASEEA